MKSETVFFFLIFAADQVWPQKEWYIIRLNHVYESKFKQNYYYQRTKLKE